MNLKIVFQLVTATVVLTQASLIFAAENPRMADAFKDVSYTQPKCFGREYSRSDLKKHPAQTVVQMKAKLMKFSADKNIESGGLAIEVRLKGEGGVNYHNEFSCQNLNGQLFCAVECDGGHVTITQLDSNMMVLKNAGFVLRGGCDSQDQKEKFLKPSRSGDDVFKLHALPAAFCADSLPDDSPAVPN